MTQSLTEVGLRPIEPGEATEFLPLFGAFLREEGAQRDSLAGLFDPANLQHMVAERLAGPDPAYFWITENGDVRGFVSWSRIHGTAGEIRSIYIGPIYRKQGFAKRALVALVEMMRAAGIQEFFTEIHEDNSASRQLFRYVGLLGPVTTTYRVFT